MTGDEVTKDRDEDGPSQRMPARSGVSGEMSSDIVSEIARGSGIEQGLLW